MPQCQHYTLTPARYANPKAQLARVDKVPEHSVMNAKTFDASHHFNGYRSFSARRSLSSSRPLSPSFTVLKYALSMVIIGNMSVLLVLCIFVYSVLGKSCQCRHCSPKKISNKNWVKEVNSKIGLFLHNLSPPLLWRIQTTFQLSCAIQKRFKLPNCHKMYTSLHKHTK